MNPDGQCALTFEFFRRRFLEEARCVAFLFQRRSADSFVCPSCGKRRAVALKSRPRLYQCLDCGRQNLDHGGHGDERFQAAVGDMVLGRASHGDAFQRDVGAAVGGPARRHLQNRLAPDAEVAAIDGRSTPQPCGVVEDQSNGNSLPRRRCIFQTTAMQGKILVIGAVEVIDRDINQVQEPQREHTQNILQYALRPHPPRHDRRQFRRVDRRFGGEPM